MTRFGKVKLATGARSTGPSQRVLRQSRSVKVPDVLCKGGVEPF